MYVCLSAIKLPFHLIASQVAWYHSVAICLSILTNYYQLLLIKFALLSDCIYNLQLFF